MAPPATRKRSRKPSGLGYAASDFELDLFRNQTDADVWLLSFWSDIAFSLYAHKKFGFRVPFPLYGL